MTNIENLRVEVELAEKAEAEAMEATLGIIRESQLVYDDFWGSFDIRSVDLESLGTVELDLKGINEALEAGAEDGVGLDEILKHRVYLSIGNAVSGTVESCVAASKRIAEAREKLTAATSILAVKKKQLSDAEN